MNPIQYIKSKGLKHALQVVYKYKIDIILQKIMGTVLKRKPLKNIIVIESHNDFDSNGGALYDYLIQQEYNRKYKIVWLVKHPADVPKHLPDNVECVPEYRPGIKKNYYKWMAKYFSCDMDCSDKLRKEQISIYLTHGAIGLKDVTGLISLPASLDFCLTASDWWHPFDARQFSIDIADPKWAICGYPSHDCFYNNQPGDLGKVTDGKFHKVFLWMPTFRRSINKRVDGIVAQKLGIPLIQTQEEYIALNDHLRKCGSLLIIKIHPKQDLSTLKTGELSNIKVLTGELVKRKNIDNYRLMKDADALISDYSSVAYDFLHLDRPIAYDFSDLEGYTRGIVVDDVHEMIAGHEIKDVRGLYDFINDVAEGKDPYSDTRRELFDRLFKYHDGQSCERIVQLLGL